MTKRPTTAPQPGPRRKRASRAEREANIQRAVLLGTVIVAVVVIGLVAFAVVNEYVIKPRRILVSVNGVETPVTVFQDRVRLDYYYECLPYVQFGLQPPQSCLDPETFAQSTLDTIINDQLVIQKAEDMGITVSDAEVQEQIELGFGYDAGEPEPTATPAPTETPSGPTPTPTITPTFVYTLTPTLTATPNPDVTPTATPTITPTPSGPPTVTPTPEPTPTSEPVTEEDFNNSFSNAVDVVSAATGIPPERVRRLFFEQTRVTLYRQRLVEELNLPVDETKLMVHAAHILVSTQEEALAVLERLNAGESFETVAAEVSRDTSNSYKGGDLGWFGRGVMVQEFEDAAFSLPVGEISGPVPTPFGWHIIKVYDRQEVPATEDDKLSQRQEEFRNLLATWRDEAEVIIDDAWQNFVPDVLSMIPGLSTQP